MPTFDHDGVSLSFDVAGSADALPIVLLHGITGARTTWHDLAADLSTDHLVFALDHRGHGQSSRALGTYDLAHWAGDLVAFLETVVGRPAVLVGHSLGGVIAAEVAGTRPDLVRGLFLEDPPMFMTLPSEFPDTAFAVIFPMMRDSFREKRDRQAPLEDYQAEAASMPALNGTGTMADVLGPEGLVRSAQATKDFDPEALTAAIEGGLDGHVPTRPLAVPTVLLRADPELVAAFREEDVEPFLTANPDATVELVRGASHLVHDEQPKLVLERIRALLDHVG